MGMNCYIFLASFAYFCYICGLLQDFSGLLFLWTTTLFLPTFFKGKNVYFVFTHKRHSTILSV